MDKEVKITIPKRFGIDEKIEITIPEGYEIDKENSTFECIKFKHIVKRWRDTADKLQGFAISSCGGIEAADLVGESRCRRHGIFATDKIAKSALAMAQISQIMTNDDRFGGVITDEEWNDKSNKYSLIRDFNKITPKICWNVYSFLAFHTEEQCELFLKENEQLVKDYLMIE